MANDETKTVLDDTSAAAVRLMLDKLADHDVAEVYEVTPRAGGDRRPCSRSDARPEHRSLATGDALTRDARILVEIADRTKPKDIPPALPAMLGCIVDHVAALT